MLMCSNEDEDVEGGRGRKKRMGDEAGERNGSEGGGASQDPGEWHSAQGTYSGIG